MATTPTGNVDDTRNTNGDYIVGNTATGGLTVDGGSVLSITAPSSQEPLLSVGFGPGVLGTVAITGVGSAINLVGNGTQASSGSGIGIGRTGTGVVTITNGALRYTDLVGTTGNASTGEGREGMTVGRGTGASGTLSLTGGNFELVGTGIGIDVGRNSGTGTFELLGSSTATVTSRFASGDSSLQVGRDNAGASPTTNATGTMVIDASTFTMTGGGGPGDTNGNTFGAYLTVGRGNATTNGTLTLKNNAVFTMNGTNSALSTTVGDAFTNIGRGGGTGTVRVESGADWVLNGGTDGAGINIGRNGNPTGSNAEPQTGAFGTAVVTGAGSTLIANTTGSANLAIGRVSGNTGTMTVENGGTVTMNGQTGSFLNVGFRSFSNDTGNGGTGTLNISGGDSSVLMRNNGTASNQFTGFNLGSFGGNGTMNIDGGKLTLSSASGIFSNIGYDGNNVNSSGTAKITVSNGGTLDYLRTTFASLNIGRGTGSDATVEVLSGGKIRMDAGGINTSNSGPQVTIGDRAGVVNAILKISGASSAVEGAGFVAVGRNAGDPNSTAGNGQLIVENLGKITANQMNIGEGGIVKGHNGRIEANVNLNGGQIGDSAVGATTGAVETLRVAGNLVLDSGRLSFDVGSGIVNNDLVAVTGQITLLANTNLFSINVNTIGGYKFQSGEVRGLMSATSGFTPGFKVIEDSVSGQNSGFSYYLGAQRLPAGAELILEALNSGDTGGVSLLDFGANSTVGAIIAYNTPSVTDGRAGGGRFGVGSVGAVSNLGTVLGTAANDSFIFTSAATQGFTANGRGGNDSITGGGANDTIIGGAAGDSLVGQSGDDLMLGDGPLALSANAGSVRRLYLATLNRGPDDGGWQGWVDQLDGGANLTNIAGGFVDSTEFKRVYGTELSNEAFVTLLYQNILKRAPDAGGLAANVAALVGGASRASIVVGLSDSEEFKGASDFELYSGQIYRLYGATLARMPDTGGFEGWTDQRGENVGLLNISSGFVNSTEFQTTYGNTTDTQFVTLLYNNVLNRAPDAAGLAGWLNELGAGGRSRSEVVLGFSESGEYINNTNAAMRSFVQQQMTVWNDTLIGGAGNDKLSGGRGSDLFIFNQGQGGTDDVFAFDAYDRVQFSGFGYADANAALARMTESGKNVVFTDQGQTITFHDAKLADMLFLII